MPSDDPAARRPPAGRVKVSPQAVASIARATLVECYSGVGLAPARRGPAMLSRLGRPDRLAAVEVRVGDGETVLTPHIIVEYGVRISEVARNAMRSVAFAVEKALGMGVCKVNGNVDGLHIADRV